jgi:hypothetical protein
MGGQNILSELIINNAIVYRPESVQPVRILIAVYINSEQLNFFLEVSARGYFEMSPPDSQIKK